MFERSSALYSLADGKALSGTLSAKKVFPLFLILVLISIVGLPLAAQTITTGQLTGIVTDPAGAAVTNGQITLKSDDTGETQTTNMSSSGEFRFSLLRPGVYTLTISSPGFEQVTQKATVSLGQSAALNIQLGVQRQSTTVNVSEQAPLLQSDTANLATTFDSTQLQNLPAPGNDMTAYAFNTPGVTISTGGGYGSFSAFGRPAVSNLFTINGIDNMDPYLNLNNSGASNLTLGSNEISEAAVVLNGYTGQYGRQAGANVNYVTKSGTNEFHGNAAWFWNGNYLNANDWFNNASGTPRPHAVSNEWAGSFGGPILRNKLFFFIDNEGLRYVLPNAGATYIPTSDFSDYVQRNLTATNSAALPLYQRALSLYAGSPGAGRATPVTDEALGCGDIIPSDGTVPTDPGALGAYNLGFGTTRPCARTFRSTVNNLNTEWLLNTRVDYNFSSRDRIYFRYNTDHGVQATGTDPINAVFNANSVQPSYGGQVGYTRTISSNMVNQLSLAASYYKAIFGPPNLSAALAAFPTTFVFNDGEYSNLGGTDYNYPSGRTVRQWQLIDDFSISAGSHSIKFGANVRRNFITTYAYGAYTSGLVTFNSMTDFVNGYMANGSTYQQNFSNIGGENLTLYSAGFYGQDEWKVRPNFTLTLALRLDRNSNIKCAAGCFSELAGPFRQVAHSANLPYNASIKTGLTQAFYSVEPVVVAPRVGFAWNVVPSTVLRGGFGIFSDLYQGLIADRLITNAPLVTSFTTSSGPVATNTSGSVFDQVAASNRAFQNGFANGVTLAQLTAASSVFRGPNLNTIGNQLYNPKVYEWNFELQQTLSNKALVSLNYVGNHGYQEINQQLFVNAYSRRGFQALPTSAPDPRFGEVRELNNQSFSNYNGFVASLRWRASSALTGQVAYTWSHALDTCSNACIEPFNALTAVSIRSQISPLSLRALNYSNADYDTRHSLNGNYVYTLPTSYFHNGLLKTVLGGWTVAGTLFWHTGYPFSVINTSVRGANSIANATGLPSGGTQQFTAVPLGGAPLTDCTTPNVPCYTSSQFQLAANQRTFGTLARNALRGPGYFDTDLNVNKTFSMGERFKLLVGAYFFNILNHPNFDLPVNNAVAGNFGTIIQTVSAPTSAYGSFQGSAVSGRVIQSQVKLTF